MSRRPRALKTGDHIWSAVGIQARIERLRQSLFFLPALFVAGAVALAIVMLFLDRHVQSESLPEVLTTTLASPRSILGAIAAGTITAASIVLSLTLVAVQLSSGQHPPRAQLPRVRISAIRGGAAPAGARCRRHHPGYLSASDRPDEVVTHGRLRHGDVPPEEVFIEAPRARRVLG